MNYKLVLFSLVSGLIGMGIGGAWQGSSAQWGDSGIPSFQQFEMGRQLELDSQQRMWNETLGYYNGPLYGPGVTPRHGGPC